ncbi:MAG: SHOCT domain-containing protein [Acidimicrobiales bacterium]
MFPRRLLSEGERVIVDMHPHWSFLGPAPAVAALAVAGLVAESLGMHDPPTALTYGLLVVTAVALAWLAARVARWRTTDFVVTSSRLVQRSGVLGRQGFDVRLERVNELSYRQRLYQRLFGYGALMVEVGGEAGVVVLEHVRRPEALCGVLNDTIATRQRANTAPPEPTRTAGTAAPPRPTSSDGVAADQHRGQSPVQGHGMGDTPPAGVSWPGRGTPAERVTSDVGKRLVELDELRRRGILTEAEFETKKAEILGNL